MKSTGIELLQPSTLNVQDYVKNGIKWLKNTDSEKLVNSTKSEEEFYGAWGYGDVTGRMVDAYILARQVLGEEIVSPQEKKNRSFLLSLFDPKDGLSYRTKPVRMAHMFDQSSVLFGLVSWYLESGSSQVQHYIERLIQGLSNIAVKKDNYCYYPLEFYPPSGWDENYPVKLGQERLEKADPCHEGGRQILPLIKYYEVTANSSALFLAEGLANYIMHHSGVFATDGSCREQKSRTHGQLHSRLATVAGILRLGLTTGKQELVKWAVNVSDWALRTQCTSFGWAAEFVDNFERGCEQCTVTDVIELALMLGRAGYMNYWDVAERFGRNHLLENQCPRTGGFSGHSQVNDLHYDFLWSHQGESIHTKGSAPSGCCSPAGVRALFLLWDNIVTKEGSLVSVNLALNRRTRWVDVQSLTPHRGELKVRVKEAPELTIRTPDWADKSKIKVYRNGRVSSFQWKKHFVALSGLKPGDEVHVKYPITRTTLTESLFGHEFKASWRGNTVITILPSGKVQPLYQRKHLDTNEVNYVPAESQKFLKKEIHW